MPEPGNPQSLNRYSYVNNNAVRYTDPSGHCIPGVNCPGDSIVSQGPSSQPVANPSSAPTANTPPSSTAPPTSLATVYWARGQGAAYWRRAHRFQGTGTPDCGPTAEAIIFNGIAGKNWDKNDVNPARWIFGSTLPGDIAKDFNQIAARENINISAESHHGGTKSNLADEIKKGNPVTILLQYEGVQAHYIDIVGYDMQNDKIMYLDPAVKSGPGVDPLVKQTWNDLAKDWDRPTFWLSTFRNYYVTYR